MIVNKKGYTLIELLAVLVILTIIVLITTPMVFNAINNAKLGSFKASVYGIIEASEYAIYKKKLTGEKITETKYEYVDGKETKTGNLDVIYKGSKPRNGILIINEAGKIALALYDVDHCITKTYDKEEIKVEKVKQEDCVLDSNVIEKPEEPDEPETPEEPKVPVVNLFDENKGVNKPVLRVVE